jgi:hypothetical protein
MEVDLTKIILALIGLASDVVASYKEITLAQLAND